MHICKAEVKCSHNQSSDNQGFILVASLETAKESETLETVAVTKTCEH